ncbi:hypothetical protein [Curtobacterium sp. Leaf183]|nr:hypothetical protein [Curtobacterium sp. Leaf183]
MPTFVSGNPASGKSTLTLRLVDEGPVALLRRHPGGSRGPA